MPANAELLEMQRRTDQHVAALARRLADTIAAQGLCGPACGDGAISQVLEAAGYSVVSTDLVDRGYGLARVDFLMERAPLAPNIVTNPPFKLDDEFVRRAISLATGKVAFLLRLNWLAGKRRRDLSERVSRMWAFSGRLPRMHRHGYDGPKTTSTIDFAWYVWDRAHEGTRHFGLLEF